MTYQSDQLLEALKLRRMKVERERRPHPHRKCDCELCVSTTQQFDAMSRTGLREVAEKYQEWHRHRLDRDTWNYI